MLALPALGIALLQQGEGVSPGGCTYRSMVLVPETIGARGLPVAPQGASGALRERDRPHRDRRDRLAGAREREAGGGGTSAIRKRAAR